jgi:hypothetical protein
MSLKVPANIDISKSPEIEKETDSSKSQKSDEHKLSGNVLVAEDSKPNQVLIRLLLEKRGLGELLPEDVIFSLQVLDYFLLLSVHPACYHHKQHGCWFGFHHISLE